MQRNPLNPVKGGLIQYSMSQWGSGTRLAVRYRCDTVCDTMADDAIVGQLSVNRIPAGPNRTTSTNALTSSTPLTIHFKLPPGVRVEKAFKWGKASFLRGTV